MKSICISSLSIAAIAICLGLAAPAGFYQQTNLLSDGTESAHFINPDLVNAWGVASSPTGPFWIANNATGTSSIVHTDGSQFAPDVNIPADHTGQPTGLVFNGGGGFEVSQGNLTSTSVFIFVTLEGRIFGWSPQVDPANAIIAVRNTTGAASYTGAAIAGKSSQRRLYVANFGQGTVDMFDARFHPAGSFADAGAPLDYSPFGVANIGGLVYVTFVLKDPATGDEVHAPGTGLIDVFSTAGVLITRLTTGGELNAPWGMVQASKAFGPFSNKILVGNFGDGRILAYDRDGQFFGQLEDGNGQALVIEGVWGLIFGNGGSGGNTNDLYFTAGPNDEHGGLFGQISFTP